VTLEDGDATLDAGEEREFDVTAHTPSIGPSGVDPAPSVGRSPGRGRQRLILSYGRL
jgi:hypothetical protein